ncbi:MAG TPA: alpha/beta hydrolase [Rhizomicrobium sp.]|jgi:pimeloyl-ACP methyl ester carboxylesterase|nr:alpha/beta hydrolase [Rhizomicrobium sp.]
MTPIWKSQAGRDAVEARYRAFLNFWPQPNRQFTVPTRQGDTFVIASGPESAPPLLLFHGSASNSFMWMLDAAQWSQHFRVYAVDMIGEPGLSAPVRPTLASGAYPLWLDDVFEALGIAEASLVGLSLGGWLALDYASRRPERVRSIAVLCPGGVGRHKNILLWAAPLLLLGAWGRRKVNAIVAGPPKPGAPPMPTAVGEFLALIYRHFRLRRERLPAISGAALRRLTMPLLAILGGKDVMIDSPGTRRRLERHVPQAEVIWLADDGHFLRGQAAPILGFLRRANGI